MVNEIKTIPLHGLNKWFDLKFRVVSQFNSKHQKKAEGRIGQNVVKR